MGVEKKILIIEDDTDLIEAMKITLEAGRFKVISATDPEKGFSIAGEEKPDLIILDVMFGEKEKVKGFDYAVKLKNDKVLAPIPILMITSVNMRYPEFHFSPESDGEYLPVDDFIDKPAKPNDLIEKVKRLIEMKTSKWINWPNPPPQEK
jgi:DNA-binding response OmpR family regulator